MGQYTEIKGCIHIHYPLSKLKDKISTLGIEGEKACLDFIIINSHTPRKNRKKYEATFQKQGYYNKVLIITAEETDDKKRQNHLLVIGGKCWYGNKDNIENLLSAVNQDETISFVAHPEGVHKLFLVKKEYFWQNWDLDGFTGIEVWSMLFDWARHTRLYNLPIRYLNFPENLTGPPKNILHLWDKLSLKRKVVGIAGLDIHSLPFLLHILDINKNFRYHRIFQGLRNHLLITEKLTGVYEEDRKRIIRTLKNGSLFFANDLLADSTGFFFGTEDGEKTMGDVLSKGTPLIVKNPLIAKTRVIFNGKMLFEEETEYSKFIAESPGVYRIEVEIKGNPWIFSNHIKVD